MNYRQLILIVLLCLFGVVSVMALEEARFPRPEFTSDYQTPVEKEPVEPSIRDPYLSVVFLIIALGLTGYFLLVKRSRTFLFFTGIACLIWFGFIFKGCVCPIGSIQNVILGLFNSEFLVPWHVVIVFFLPLIVALFFGRLFCGSVCPFGFLQELVIFRPIKVPGVIDRILRLIPFAFLGLGVWFAVCELGFIFCMYDPFIGLFRFDSSASMALFAGGVLILGTFVARPYCRYLCPYSVLLSAASLLAWKKVQIYPKTCVNCELCLASCPVDAIAKGVDPSSVKAYPEKRESAIRRLKWLVALSPLIIAAFAFTGLRLGEKIADSHPDIILHQDVQAAKYEEDNVVAFFANDGNEEKLKSMAGRIKKKIRTGGGIFGIYMSFVVIGSVFAATRRKIYKFHTVETWNCVSCARCYAWCPQNQEKKL